MYCGARPSEFSRDNWSRAGEATHRKDGGGPAFPEVRTELLKTLPECFGEGREISFEQRHRRNGHDFHAGEQMSPGPATSNSDELVRKRLFHQANCAPRRSVASSSSSSRTGGPPCRAILMRTPTAKSIKSKLEPP